MVVPLGLGFAGVGEGGVCAGWATRLGASGVMVEHAWSRWAVCRALPRQGHFSCCLSGTVRIECQCWAKRGDMAGSAARAERPKAVEEATQIKALCIMAVTGIV